MLEEEEEGIQVAAGRSTSPLCLPGTRHVDLLQVRQDSQDK